MGEVNCSPLTHRLFVLIRGVTWRAHPYFVISYVLHEFSFAALRVKRDSLRWQNSPLPTLLGCLALVLAASARSRVPEVVCRPADI